MGKKRDLDQPLLFHFHPTYISSYMQARLTDKPIHVGFKIELMVAPIMPQLHELGGLEDYNGTSTPRYFRTVLPIQGDDYKPDPRFLNVVKRILRLVDLPVEGVYVPDGEPSRYQGWAVHGDPSLRPVSLEAGKVSNSQSPWKTN